MTDEKRPPICKECKHPLMNGGSWDWKCEKNIPINPVTGEPWPDYCHAKNLCFACTDYEAAEDPAPAPPTCADCNTPLTSSDQYALRDGKHICAPGYGCRESEKRHSELDEEGVKV